MTFIFRNMTIFWDIPKWLPKWNKGQTNWNEGSNILLNPTHTFMAADPSLEKANHAHMRERERESLGWQWLCHWSVCGVFLVVECIILL